MLLLDCFGTAKDASIDNTDPSKFGNVLSSITSLGTKRRKREKDEIDEDSYNEYQGDDLFEKLAKAEGLDEKAEVLSAFMAHLRNKPARILQDIVEKVDESIYRVFYNEPRRTEDGKIVHGFFNNLMFDAKDIFQKIGNEFTNFVIDPAKKTFEKMQNSDLAKNTGKELKRLGSNVFNAVTGSFSRVLGGENNQETPDENGMTKDIYKKYQKMWSNYADIHAKGKNENKRIKNKQKIIKDIAISTEKASKGDLSAFKKMHKLQKEAYEQYKLKFGPDPDIETMIVKDDVQLKSMMSEAGENVDDRVFNEAKFKFASAQNKVNNFNQLQGDFINQFGTGYKTTDTRSAVYKQGGKLRSSLFAGKARGDSYIPKTGLYALSKGEMVVPSTMNPFNPYKTNIEDDEKREKEYLKNVTKNTNIRVEGNYAQGTVSNTTMEKMRRWKENQSTGLFDSIRGGAANMFFMGKGQDDNDKTSGLFSEGFKKIFPNAAASGILGSVAGLVTLGPMGMLAGLTLGVGSSLAQNVTGFNNFLFGKKDEKGNREGGLIGKDVAKWFDKYFPSFKDYATIGGVVGAGLSAITGSPLGIIGGIAVGGAYGLIKRSQQAADNLYGKAKSGIQLPKSISNHLKKHLGKTILSMIGGGIAGGLTFGPFGLVGGIALGASLSYLSSTQAFEDAILGKKNEKGEREGGLVGMIKNVLEPLSKRVLETKDSFDKYLKTEVFEPLKRGIKPLFKLAAFSIADITKALGKQIVRPFKSDMMKLFLNKVPGRFLKSEAGMSLAATLGATAMFGPLAGLYTAAGATMLRSKTGRKIAKTLTSAVPKLIGKLGDKAQARLIKQGRELGMNAKQRLAFMRDKGFGSYNTERLDEHLASADKNDLDAEKTQIDIYKDGKEKVAKKFKEFDGGLSDDLINKFPDIHYKDSRKIVDAVKSMDLSNKEQAEKFKKIVQKATPRFSRAKQEEVMKWALSKNKQYHHLKGANENFEKAAANIRKNFMDRYGVDIDKMGADKISKMFGAELTERKEDEGDKVLENANENTEKITDKLTNTNALLLEILKVMHGEEYSPDEMKRLSELTGVQVNDDDDEEYSKFADEVESSDKQDKAAKSEKFLKMLDRHYSGIYNSKNVNSEQLAKMEDVVDQMRGTHTGLEKDRKFDALHSIERSLKSGASGEDVDKALDIYQELVKNNKIKFIKEINSRIKWLSKNCPFVTVTVEAVSKINEDEWPIIKNILEYTSREKERTLYFTESHPINLNLLANRDATELRHILSRLKQFFKQGINVTLDDLIRSLDLGNSNVIADLKQLHNGEKMTHGTIDPSKEVKEAEEKAKQANENVAKATGTEESVGEEAAEQAVSSIEKDANKMALGGVTVTAEEGETVGTQVLKAEATAKEASKTADKALTTSNNSAPEASSSKEAYEESEKEKKLIETQENIASSLNSISEKLNADDTKEGKEKKKEEESGFFSNLFGGMGKMFSFLSNNLLKGGLMAIAGMTALTAIGEALGIDPETIQNFFSEHLVGGAMAGIATMWGAKKLITTGLKTGAKYAGKAVGWAAGKAWDLTKKGASKVGEAAIKVISGSKEKVMMKGAEVVQDVASKFAPIKNAIIDSMNELGKMVKKMSWFDGKLANIFNKFSKRFMEKIANPVMASKIVTKFAAKMGTTAAAVAFPPALVAEAVIGAGIGFADGVANAKEYWQKDDVSLAERAGAGVIGGIIGAIPVVGWVFDAGDLIALWKMCTSDDKNETSESDEETSKDIDVEKERKEQLDAAKRGNEGKNEKNVKTLDEAVKDPNYAPRNLAGAQALEKKKKEEEDKKRKEESLKDSKSMYSSNPNDYNGQGKYGRGLAGQFNSQIDPNNSMGFNIPGDRSSQSMYDSGCGPVSATNALSALGIGADPKSAAAFALGKGYKEKDGGTKPGFFKDYLGSLGVGTSDISGSNADIKSALGSGTPVILMGRDANGISSNNPYGKGAHYVTATGMDGKGNIIVQDPESNSPNAVYKADNVLSKSSIAIAAGRSKWGRGFRWGRSVSASSDEGKSIPKRIWNALKNHGVSDVAVAAIMGNIYAESAYNPQARNPNGGAFGLCQWLGDRQDNLSAFAAKRGTPMDSPDTQVEFLWAELSGVESEAYNAIKNMEEKDLDLATETFCRKFERCSEDEARSSMGKRIAAARDAYKKKGDVPANVAYNPANYTMKGSASSSSGGIGGFMGQIGSAALKAAKAIYGEDALKMVFGDSNPFGGGDESNSSNSSDGSNGATSRDGTVKKVSFAKNKGSALDYLLEYFKTKDPEAIITSEFNKPREGYNHGGVDIGVNAGVPIPTPVNGKVVDIGNQEGGYGQFIQVEDKKGNLHIFPHYSQLGEGMAVGKEVTKGDIVAYIGSTGHSDGPHLHYEIDPPSNPGAQSHGEHLDPGTYDIGNAPTTFDNSDPNYNDGGYGKYGRGGKLMKRINSNNKAANKLIKKVPKKEKDIPYASEGFMMGKGAQAATAMLQPSTIESQSNFNKNTTIDYNDKFDAIISLLTKIAGALVGAASNTGGSMATTPSMQFGGGVTGVGDSFDKGDISKIMDAMNSLAIKNTDSKMGL